MFFRRQRYLEIHYFEMDFSISVYGLLLDIFPSATILCSSFYSMLVCIINELKNRSDIFGARKDVFEEASMLLLRSFVQVCCLLMAWKITISLTWLVLGM